MLEIVAVLALLVATSTTVGTWASFRRMAKEPKCVLRQLGQRGLECDACGLTSASYAEGTVGG